MLNGIAEKYFDDYLALHPLAATAMGDHRFDDRFGDYASMTWLADGLAIEQETLEKLAALDASQLTAHERLTFEALRRGREANAEAYRYPTELLPLDAVSELAATFAMLGSGRDVQPFRTASDYRNFLSRMDGFVVWVDQVINNLRSGVAKGIVEPRAVVERLLPSLAAIAVPDPQQSIFWQPILNFPASLTVTERRQFIAEYRERLGQRVLPAYRRLRDYLQKEYLPEARTTHIGMGALPSGDAWYAYLVRYYSGTNFTPEQVHELGLREVARERAETERLLRQAGVTASVHDYLESMRADSKAYYGSGAELLAGYGSIRDRVRAAMPLLFAAEPRTPLVIRPVEPLLGKLCEATAYRAAPVDGSGPGVLLVNTTELSTRPKYLMETAFLGAGLPGLHLQASLARENERLPRIRRFGDEVTLREGWSLYAQTLGRDLGVYSEAGSLLGSQSLRLWMAARLVVDTGLHAKGWTREQAIAYLRANTGLGDADAAADVDRCLAAPGRWLAPAMGELKIQELRRRAEASLGPRFDIREFHAVALGGGWLPLAVLETQVDRWIAAKK